MCCAALRDRLWSMTSLVAACTTRAGQTSTYWAVSVAWSLAETRSVVLVDCDMEGGTIADLLYLPVQDRSIANCLGDRSATASALAAQAVTVPERPTLRVVPGLRGTFGYDVIELLRQISAALRGLACDTVIADLGHPLAHPGLRSPRAAAEAICSTFHRVFVVLRDEPALISRSLDVLRSSKLARGELVVCEQRSKALRRVLVESLQREVPDLPVRDGWSWDERRAARMAETGRPIALNGIAKELNL
jgi:MinD-like ATPase involved in chromosome partitioning or flagellar assembly